MRETSCRKYWSAGNTTSRKRCPASCWRVGAFYRSFLFLCQRLFAHSWLQPAWELLGLAYVRCWAWQDVALCQCRQRLRRNGCSVAPPHQAGPRSDGRSSPRCQQRSEGGGWEVRDNLRRRERWRQIRFTKNPSLSWTCSAANVLQVHAYTNCLHHSHLTHRQCSDSCPRPQ